MCSSFDRTLWPRNRETIDVSSFPSPPPFIYQFLPTCPLQNSPLFPHFPGIQKLERRAQLTEKQALSLNTTEVHKLINSANAVSARLNTATGEISRNPGGAGKKSAVQELFFAIETVRAAVGRFHFDPRANSACISDGDTLSLHWKSSLWIIMDSRSFHSLYFPSDYIYCDFHQTKIK